MSVLKAKKIDAPPGPRHPLEVEAYAEELRRLEELREAHQNLLDQRHAGKASPVAAPDINALASRIRAGEQIEVPDRVAEEARRRREAEDLEVRIAAWAMATEDQREVVVKQKEEADRLVTEAFYPEARELARAYLESLATTIRLQRAYYEGIYDKLEAAGVQGFQRRLPSIGITGLGGGPESLGAEALRDGIRAGFISPRESFLEGLAVALKEAS